MQDYQNGNNPIANQVVSVGPCVGEYLFHETNGATAHDISSIHNNGLLSGGAGWSPTSGYDGQGAITFDGTSGEVTISDTNNQVLPAAGAPFSFALWFQPNVGLTGTAVLMNAGTPGVSGFQVGIDSSQSPPNLFFSTFGSAGTKIETPLLSGSAAWTQVALTYDGTNASIYVDGLEQISGTATLVSSTSAITLGMNGGGSQPFAGAIENLTFYQAVLQEPDVSCLYNISTTATGPDTSQLANYWKYLYFGTLTVDPNGLVPWSAGQLTNLQAFEEGMNPLDYYDGQPPTLSIVSGTNQIGSPGGFVPAPLVVAVTDSDGNPIVDAPVTFSVTSGTLQTSSGGTPGTSVIAFTDKNGIAQIFFQLPAAVSSTSQITFSAGTGSSLASGTFSASSDGGSGQFISPFAPSDCLGTVNGDGNLVLTWDNNTDNETAIYIEQQQSGGSWSEIASVGPGTSTYTVMSPTPGAYRIDAQLPSGDPPSGPVFVPIPVQSYVVIDVSGSNVTSNVQQIALDDSNNVAFAFSSGTDSDGQPAAYNVYTWVSGTLTTVTPLPLDKTDTIVLNGSSTNTVEISGSSQPVSVHLTPTQLLASGTVFGDLVMPIPGGAIERGFSASAGSSTDIYLPQPYMSYDVGAFGGSLVDDNFSLNAVASNGDVSGGGIYSNTGFNGGDGSGDPAWMDFIVSTSGSSSFAPFVPSDAHVAGLDTDEVFEPYAINRNGWGLGIGYEPTDDSDPYDPDIFTWTALGFQIWDGQEFHSLNSGMDQPIAVDDENYVIGTSSNGAFVWMSGTGLPVCPLIVSNQETRITQLIPAPYQKRIVSVNPIAISGTNPIDGSIRILLSGTYQTDSNGDTSNGTFLLTLTSGTSAISSGTAETIFQQVYVPSGFGANLASGILNSQGAIAALGTAPTSSGTAALLLLPVQLKNLADPTLRNGANYKDTQVSFLQSSTDTNINSVAWIAASDSSQPVVINGIYPPRMPELVASSGSMSGLTFNWKLQVTFHDRYGNPHRDFDSGDPNCSNTNAYILTDPIVNPSAHTSDTPDQVTIPSDGSWHQISDGSPWNVYQDTAWTTATNQGFFGGDAVVSLKITDNSGNIIVPEQDYKFRIAGENPSAATAKAFLTGTYGGPSAAQALGSNPHAWFAWAIAKDETGGEGSRGYYNHFLTNGGNPVTSKGFPSNKSQPWPGHEGRPNWNDDGTNTNRKTGSGGYGLFQLTYQSRNTMIRRHGQFHCAGRTPIPLSSKLVGHVKVKRMSFRLNHFIFIH